MRFHDYTECICLSCVGHLPPTGFNSCLPGTQLELQELSWLRHLLSNEYLIYTAVVRMNIKCDG